MDAQSIADKQGNEPHAETCREKRLNKNVDTKQGFNDEICLNPAMYHRHSIAKKGNRVATPRLIINHEVLSQTTMEDYATR